MRRQALLDYRKRRMTPDYPPWKVILVAGGWTLAKCCMTVPRRDEGSSSRPPAAGEYRSGARFNGEGIGAISTFRIKQKFAN